MGARNSLNSKLRDYNNDMAFVEKGGKVSYMDQKKLKRFYNNAQLRNSTENYTQRVSVDDNNKEPVKNTTTNFKINRNIDNVKLNLDKNLVRGGGYNISKHQLNKTYR